MLYIPQVVANLLRGVGPPCTMHIEFSEAIYGNKSDINGPTMIGLRDPEIPNYFYPTTR